MLVLLCKIVKLHRSEALIPSSGHDPTSTRYKCITWFWHLHLHLKSDKNFANISFGYEVTRPPFNNLCTILSCNSLVISFISVALTNGFHQQTSTSNRDYKQTKGGWWPRGEVEEWVVRCKVGRRQTQASVIGRMCVTVGVLFYFIKKEGDNVVCFRQ